MGLTLMGSEILLLLGFQAVYGYVFNELAVIIAGVMAGMGIGSGSALRRQEHLPTLRVASEIRRLLIMQLSASAFILLLTPLIFTMGKMSSSGVPPILIHVAFLLLALTCGFIGGYQFPSAMRLLSAVNRERNVSPGFIYGVDLFGASFGAIIISVFLLPLFGFSHTAELMGIANLGPIIWLAMSLKDAFRPAS
jgi:predicted membrane-bound spermidine synthase